LAFFTPFLPRFELFEETLEVWPVDFDVTFFFEVVTVDFDLEFERVLAQEPGTSSNSAQSAPTIRRTICRLNLKTAP
jgi:hypothetical protein